MSTHAFVLMIFTALTGLNNNPLVDWNTEDIVIEMEHQGVHEQIIVNEFINDGRDPYQFPTLSDGIQNVRGNGLDPDFE